MPISGIREVVAHPPVLAELPPTLAGLRGALDLRGAMIPVVELGEMIGGLHGTVLGGQAECEETADPTAAGPATRGVVMVLRTERGVFGACADEICGVVDLSRDRRTALELSSSGPVETAPVIVAGFSHGGRTGVILDVEGLAAVPGLILAEDRRVAASARRTGGPPLLTFSVGPHRFGLCADVIEATMPRTAVLQSPVDDPLWIGRIVSNGSRLPLVDTLHLLGLGRQPPMREAASIVVRLEDGGRVALAIDAVLDMVAGSRDENLGLQGFGVGEGGLIAGLHAAEPPILLFDPAALKAHEHLASLASLEEKVDTTEGVGRASAGGTLATGAGKGADMSAASRMPFLIFTLGDDQHAAPLDHVTEILPYDAARMIDMAEGDGRFAGMIAHRGAAVPVVDLATRLGQVGGGGDPRFILIATSTGMSTGAGASAGFLLGGLCAVERHQLRSFARTSGAATEAATATGRGGKVIRTREGRTCTVHDLVGLVESLRAA